MTENPFEENLGLTEKAPAAVNWVTVKKINLCYGHIANPGFPHSSNCKKFLTETR